MPFTILDHTADTGVEATAGSLSGLIEELARGMFGLVATTDHPSRWVETSVAATTDEDLVVDALSELLFLSETEDVIFGRFEVTLAGPPGMIRIRAGGVPSSEATVHGPPVKAVTYHGLRVEERPHGWYGRVYLDV